MTACARLGCGHSKSMHDTGWDAAGCMFSDCGCGAYEAPTTPDTPATAAGRTLLADMYTFEGQFLLWTSHRFSTKSITDVVAKAILAIEAEARSVPRPDLSCIHKPGHPDDCDDCECVPTRPEPLTLPPCVTAKEAQDIARFIDAAIATARQPLLDEVARLHQRPDEPLEALSALEHDQWVEWSQSIAHHENLTAERMERWSRLWVPYADLSDADKEHDRVWARKVLAIVRPDEPLTVERLAAALRETTNYRWSAEDVAKRILAALGIGEKPEPGVTAT